MPIQERKLLSEKNIAWAIGISASGQAADSTIATRLGRGLGPVRAALKALVDAGAIKQVDGEPVRFEMIPAGERVSRISVEHADDEAEVIASNEMIRAEAMWKQRLGMKRWRDDPRSIAETQKTPERFVGVADHPYTLAGVSNVYG